jgi:hypothetical protein
MRITRRTLLSLLAPVAALAAAPFGPGRRDTALAAGRPGGGPAVSPVPVRRSDAPRSGGETVRALLVTGQPAPGGGTFTEFSDPSLNNRGDLAFGALSTSARTHTSLYLLSGGHLRTLVVAGQPAPTGGVFRAFSDIVLNDRGTIMFLGRTTNRAVPEGLYFAREGRVATFAAVGQPAPSGGVFTDFANPTINGQDTIAFVGRTTGPGVEGIFTSAEGSTSTAVLAGQPAPGGGEFQFFLDGTPALNDRGEIALVAATTVRSTQGIYVQSGGRLITLVTTDDAAPLGGRFTEFGSVVLTNAGTVAFIGRTDSRDVPEGLYVTGRAILVPLAMSGEPVTGGALTRFANAVINSDEEVVFELSLPIIPQAVYIATRAGVRPAVRAGDRSPAGGLFTAFSTPALNDAGQIAFVAETDDGRHGIYLVTPR